MIPQGFQNFGARGQAFLSSLLLFGKADYPEITQFLMDDYGTRIKIAADEILTLERPKRIKLLVTKLKALLKYDQQSTLSVIEVSWLVDALNRESPAVAAAILHKLSPSFREGLLSRMPGQSAKAIATINLSETADTGQFLRAFEQQFAPMPYEDLGRTLFWHHLILLSPRDLLSLIRDVGTHALAILFNQLGTEKSAQLLLHFEREVQAQVLQLVKGVRAPMMALGFQQILAKKVFESAFGVEDLIQRLGLFLLAEVGYAKYGDRVQALAQRMPMAHGRVMLQHVRDLEETQEKVENVEALEMYILGRVIELAGRGKIDGRFAHLSLNATDLN